MHTLKQILYNMGYLTVGRGSSLLCDHDVRWGVGWIEKYFNILFAYRSKTSNSNPRPLEVKKEFLQSNKKNVCKYRIETITEINKTGFRILRPRTWLAFPQSQFRDRDWDFFTFSRAWLILRFFPRISSVRAKSRLCDTMTQTWYYHDTS